jgi:hypothetical protein
MKRLLTSLCVAGLVACAGCNSSPTGGRTASTGSTTNRTGAMTGETTTQTTTSGKKESFKLKGPSSLPETRVEQGTSKTFSVSISRDSNFKDDVTLKADTDDPKVHVTLEPSVFKGSEKKDVEATAKVDDDAKLGEHTIRITGTPQAGAPTTLEVKIDVTAKAKNK